jgi:hypothetical protein
MLKHAVGTGNFKEIKCPATGIDKCEGLLDGKDVEEYANRDTSKKSSSVHRYAASSMRWFSIDTTASWWMTCWNPTLRTGGAKRETKLASVVGANCILREVCSSVLRRAEEEIR